MTSQNPQMSLAREISRATGNSILVSRWLGAWADFIVAFGVLLLGNVLLGDELYQKTLAIWLLLPVLYFVVGEWRFGRTIGKVLTGTIVVTESGGRPSLLQAVVRTLLRIAEVNPFVAGGIPAGIVAALTPSKQRVGDITGGHFRRAR